MTVIGITRAVALATGLLAIAATPAAADPLWGLTRLVNGLSAAAAPVTAALTPLAGVPGNMNAPDLNGDGRADIAVPTFGTDFLSVRINRGDGTFGPLTRYKVGVKPSFIARGDFNRDGKVDLATSNAATADVSVLLGNGDGTLQPARSYSISGPNAGILGHSNGSFSLEAADVDGDGIPDIVTSNSFTNDLSVLRGRGDGTFAPAKTFPIAGPNSLGLIPFALSVADVDGDGDMDAITGGVTSVTIMLNDGHGNFRATSSNFVGLDVACTKVGDLNEDGRPDLAATGTATLNTLVLLGRGDGSFAAGQNLTSSGLGTQCFSMADFNHDGHLDLSVVNSASLSLNGVVAIFMGDGTGHFTNDPVRSVYPVNYAPWATDTADFNGDGKLDLAVANSVPASVSILSGHGDGTFAPQVSYGM